MPCPEHLRALQQVLCMHDLPEELRYTSTHCRPLATVEGHSEHNVPPVGVRVQPTQSSSTKRPVSLEASCMHLDRLITRRSFKAPSDQDPLQPPACTPTCQSQGTAHIALSDQHPSRPSACTAACKSQGTAPIASIRFFEDHMTLTMSLQNADSLWNSLRAHLTHCQKQQTGSHL